MSNGHHTSQLSLTRSKAARLARSAQPRWLRVTAGSVWLTRSGAGLEGDDVWLAAGERLALPAGTEWVAEGWPEAQAEVVADAPAGGAARPAFAWLAAWPKLRQS